MAPSTFAPGSNPSEGGREMQARSGKFRLGVAAMFDTKWADFGVVKAEINTFHHSFIQASYEIDSIIS
jgi:hypothetical protein